MVMPQIETNYVYVNCEREVTALYRCSHCLNPVIRRFAVTVTEVASILTVKRAPKKAEDACESMKTRLQKHLNEPEEEIFGVGQPTLSSTTYKITGMNTPCPVCGAKEPWQEKKTLWKQPTAFPVQFCSGFCEAFEKAKGILRRRTVEAGRAQTDSQHYSAAVLQYDRAAAALQSLKNEMDNAPVIARYRKLQQDNEAAEARIRQLGAFSTEKRQLQKMINSNRIELRKSEEEYKTELSRYELRIMKAEQKYIEAGFFLRNYTGQTFMKEKDDVIALALCEENSLQEEGESVSLSLFPQCGRFIRSPLEKNNTDMVDLFIRKSQAVNHIER